MRTLPKSLHTVTVLVRVAQDLQRWDHLADPRAALHHACTVLGLDDTDDRHGLMGAAFKQLSQGTSK